MGEIPQGIYMNWSVVSNIFFFHFIYGLSSGTHWRTPWFFKMVGIPPTSEPWGFGSREMRSQIGWGAAGSIEKMLSIKVLEDIPKNAQFASGKSPCWMEKCPVSLETYKKLWKDPPCLMDKSTISTGPVSSSQTVNVYQRYQPSRRRPENSIATTMITWGFPIWWNPLAKSTGHQRVTTFSGYGSYWFLIPEEVKSQNLRWLLGKHHKLGGQGVWLTSLWSLRIESTSDVSTRR